MISDIWWSAHNQCLDVDLLLRRQHHSNGDILISHQTDLRISGNAAIIIMASVYDKYQEACLVRGINIGLRR